MYPTRWRWATNGETNTNRTTNLFSTASLNILEREEQTPREGKREPVWGEFSTCFFRGTLWTWRKEIQCHSFLFGSLCAQSSFSKVSSFSFLNFTQTERACVLAASGEREPFPSLPFGPFSSHITHSHPNPYTTPTISPPPISSSFFLLSHNQGGIFINAGRKFQ